MGECLRKSAIQRAASRMLSMTEASSPWMSGFRYSIVLDYSFVQNWSQLILVEFTCRLSPYLTMQLSYLSVASKYTRPLRAEDYALLSQQNDQYRSLFKTMTEKEALLTSQLQSLSAQLERTQNEKEEYRIKNGELSSKLAHFQLLKDHLASDYSVLKEEINGQMTAKTHLEDRLSHLSRRCQELEGQNLRLEVELSRRVAEVEELETRATRMQGEVLANKLALFKQTVEGGQSLLVGKQNKKPLSTLPKRNSPSFVESRTNSQGGTLSNSKANSISFSLLSNESKPDNSGKNSVHNKSIFV